MRIKTLYPGSFGANCRLLIAQNGQAAVVDPSPNAETVTEALRAEQATLSVILLTHGHFDHILSLDALRDAAGVRALIHREDLEMPADAERNAFAAFFRQRRIWRTPDGMFEDGDTIPVGDETVTVLHTPGHTPGSVCFSCNGGRDLLTGDTLMDGAYGRYDLPGGDGAKLLSSLRRLATLPAETRIYPGHGADVRLGDALDAIGIW